MLKQQKRGGRSVTAVLSETTIRSVRRSRIETYCDILIAIGAGIEKPTRIMYEANLSWIVLCDHLRVLTEERLVVATQDGTGRKLYHLSSKGHELLKEFLTFRGHLGFLHSR
jgi:predicted transcriptional regulator